jgi:phasin family protein
MADVPDPSAESAEKAYAQATVTAEPGETEKPQMEAAPSVKPLKASAKKAAKTRTAAAKATVRRPPLRKKAPEKTFAETSTVSELKEKIMATAKTTDDFTKPINEAIGEFQARAKAAYEQGSEALTEATEFTKGNVEAVVESGKILASGAQEFGKAYVEEARSAYETLTADLKELAAVKSPTELFQLQGKIARRNFDALVASSSKNTEAAIKLANEAFAPISGRVNAAAEKLTQAA